MKLYSSNDNYKLYQGNMLDMLEVIEPESIDSIITDPPYGLTSITKRFGKQDSAECQYGKDGSFARLSKGFMGKEWDGSGIEYNIDTWQKCYEVLKPGGYLLAFGGSRTFHRIACAIEDAGFEIRDTIMWLYGSGFPKSMDISKQIDKRADNNNEVIKAKEELGKWLKEKRGNRPQKEISKYFPSKTGGLTGCVANWEKGYNLPTWEIWVKLKEILDLDDRYDYLIEDRPSNYIEAEREVIGKMENPASSIYSMGENKMNRDVNITIPSTDLAKQWQGWGTALKPSFEPIIVARKPFKGSLVDNVIEYGVGGINIDECRVETNETITNHARSEISANNHIFKNKSQETHQTNGQQFGRFPANTILTYDDTDYDEVCGGFPDTTSKRTIGKMHDIRKGSLVGSSKFLDVECEMGYNDNGSASRYFYCAKASKKDRDEGLEELENKPMYQANNEHGNLGAFYVKKAGGEIGDVQLRKNTHPTVKPTELMQYLIRLVSPDGATILDPFNGSGSTGKAVMYENKERNKNYKYIGIELTEEYLPIAKARIEYAIDNNIKVENEKKEGQLTIFDFEG